MFCDHLGLSWERIGICPTIERKTLLHPLAKIFIFSPSKCTGMDGPMLTKTADSKQVPADSFVMENDFAHTPTG
jgi:hypothetical protein